MRRAVFFTIEAGKRGVDRVVRTGAVFLAGLAILAATLPIANAAREVETETIVVPGTTPLDPGPRIDPDALDDDAAGDPEPAQTPAAAPGPPDVFYDLGHVPEAVRRVRAHIINAAEDGEPEAFRALFFDNGGAPHMGSDPDDAVGADVDPVARLVSLSGDGTGQEVLAILIEVLEAGFIHLDPGTPDEVFVWPYFYRMPIHDLSPRQKVELFKIVTAGDYEDMLAFGAYTFFRVGITPDGVWQFFLVGD